MTGVIALESRLLERRSLTPGMGTFRHWTILCPDMCIICVEETLAVTNYLQGVWDTLILETLDTVNFGKSCHMKHGRASSKS